VAVPNGSICLANKAYARNTMGSPITAQAGFANAAPKHPHRKSFAFSSFLYRYRNLLKCFLGKRKMPEAHPPDPTNEATLCLMPSSSSAHAYEPPLMSLRPTTPSARIWDAEIWDAETKADVRSKPSCHSSVKKVR